MSIPKQTLILYYKAKSNFMLSDREAPKMAGVEGRFGKGKKKG